MVRRPLALVVIATLALGACGDGTSDSEGSTDSTTVSDVELIPGESTTTVPRTPKPAVSVPAQIPTELQITDLVTGTGYAAAVGDQLVVDYVGVRTAEASSSTTATNGASPTTFPSARTTSSPDRSRG